jgi:hypothetical protein
MDPCLPVSAPCSANDALPVSRLPASSTMPQWNKARAFSRCDLNGRPSRSCVRYAWSGTAQVGDPVRVAVAVIEVEGRIEAVESSTLHVRIGRRLF